MPGCVSSDRREAQDGTFSTENAGAKVCHGSGGTTSLRAT